MCTALAHQAFSSGDAVAGADVVCPFNRINKINGPNGPASLIAAMRSVSAKGNSVTFVLMYPDATWPDVLTSGAGAIADGKVFAFNKLQPDARIVGSGPYQLQSDTLKQLAVFTPNRHYGGTDVLHNNKFTIRCEESGSTLVSDVQQGAVDIGYRDLTPTRCSSWRRHKASSWSRARASRTATSSST